jgi:hypothetical protein
MAAREKAGGIGHENRKEMKNRNFFEDCFRQPAPVAQLLVPKLDLGTRRKDALVSPRAVVLQEPEFGPIG